MGTSIFFFWRFGGIKNGTSDVSPATWSAYTISTLKRYTLSNSCSIKEMIQVIILDLNSTIVTNNVSKQIWSNSEEYIVLLQVSKSK